jgi:hypothetical protein
MLNLQRVSSRPVRLRQDLIEMADTWRHPKHQTSDGHTVPFDCFDRATLKPGTVKSEVSRGILSIDDIMMSVSSDGSRKAQQRREGGDGETEQTAVMPGIARQSASHPVPASNEIPRPVQNVSNTQVFQRDIFDGIGRQVSKHKNIVVDTVSHPS